MGPATIPSTEETSSIPSRIRLRPAAWASLPNFSDVAWTYGTTVYQSNTGTDTFGNLDTYVNVENIYGSVHNDILNAANSAEE